MFMTYFVKNLHITNDDDDIIIEEMISRIRKIIRQPMQN